MLNRTHNNSAQHLRHLRLQAWCQSALATIYKTATPQVVCEFWSDATDSIINDAWQICDCSKTDLAVFALGKWGSRELNLSSDIDVIFVSSENPTILQFKCVRKFISLLTERNDSGFCYRVDTDLKPGGRLAPLISSIKQFEDYYWSFGETWERLALVRLRSIVGTKNIIESVYQIAEKFVFRRFIDFSLLEDLKHLRSRIHTHYQQLRPERINLKLAPGGIRDIELFIHALQVIHGGKYENLRTTSTTFAASQLVAADRFNKDDLEFLIDCYWQFRYLENYVQALDDAQTHDWLENLGSKEYSDFFARADRVVSIVETVLGKSSNLPLLPISNEEQSDWLRSLGFQEITISQRFSELIALTAISTRTYQDEELRKKIIRLFVEEIASISLDRDLGIALLIDFFKATRAKTGFFSLLANEPRLIRDLCTLFGCSPYLGGVLSSRPELLDSYLYNLQPKPSQNFEIYLDELAERRLLNEIVAANQFLQTKNLNFLYSAMVTTADEISLQLLESIKKNVGESSLQILALGKWGGKELGFRSDLDFIFLTEDSPKEIDHRVAKRFISHISEPHKGGSIYEMDMRLRVAGKGGPLLVSRESLLNYLTNKAEPWERQTYLRARSINNNKSFDLKIHAACINKFLSVKDLSELLDIRKKLIKTPGDQYDIKYFAGGLIDLEFAAQIAILKKKIFGPSDTSGMINAISNTSPEWAKQHNDLDKNYSFLRLVEQLFQLMSHHSTTMLGSESEGFSRVARLIGLTPAELDQQIGKTLKQNSTILKTLDPRQLQT
ncbi:MAG: hypothetical protein A2Z20_02760 [Bdellovibrionales bacterium RBG_16_40_8]|nr:MAG: hypothetical protein A2Z20_02760 [Bdellovibrionales bacterium RBG_16_40_8]